MADFTASLKPAYPDGATVIAQERQGSSIPVDELSRHLLTPTFLSRQGRVLDALQKDPVFSKTNQANLSRPDRYKLGLARGKRTRQLVDKHGWDEEDQKMAEYLIDDVSPYHLHNSMFVTTVREQASDAQRAYWLPKIESWQIIGSYAQTELGHGSNVRGLECEARWDPKSKEFIIHSPTLTASKWWNGTMGRTANHAIVVAQLMIPESSTGSPKYKSYGPHTFIVQIRDLKTHQPPLTIRVGDIGPKYGYASMDNGYMLFDNHRVPYDAMLSRYSRIDLETNEYIKPVNPNVVYGSLTYVRAQIIMHARLVLARAVTVAVRYLSIRRQFKDRDGDGSGIEIAVLDYPTVQIRVLPLLATAFALHYSGKAMGELYWRTRKNIEQGDFAALADLHSISSGLKSLCTDLAANGIETCRRSMGGHGFGGGSGLVQLNSDYLSKPTVEGDNWMITQQVAAYVIKKAKGLAQTPKSGSTKTEEILKKYFYTRDRRPMYDVLDSDEDIVQAFEWRAAHLTFKAYEAREVEKRSWNSLLIDFHKLSRAHSQSILVSNFYDALKSDQDLSVSTREVLWNLYRLFAYSTMDTEGRDFFSAGAASNETLDRLSARVLDLMQKVRPHAVRLVDAWSIPDYLLDSALGRYDGKVYEDLYNRAHVLNPLNKTTFNPDYRNDEIVLGSGDAGQVLSKL